MENAIGNGDRLNLVITASPSRSLFAETGSDSFDVGQDDGFPPTTTDEGIEQNRLEE